MSERDIFEVANQLHGYIDEGTSEGLARFLRREGDEACNLAKQIVALKAENETLREDNKVLRTEACRAWGLLRETAERALAERAEGRQDNEPRAYIVHAPEDDYYGTGPDRLQFHPLAQRDLDNGYRQTPLYGRPALELSENTGELIDKMAEAIRGDTTSDDTPWATLSEDRKIGWRGDAERALAVVKEYLTARRPAEQAVTEAGNE